MEEGTEGALRRVHGRGPMPWESGELWEPCGVAITGPPLIGTSLSLQNKMHKGAGSH